MPQTCSVCRHPQRPAIDRALVAGTSIRDIAGQFSLSRSAVERHRAEHVPLRLVKREEERQTLDADELLAQAKGLYSKAVGLLRQAESAGDVRAALVGVRTALAVLELLLEVEGRLHRAPQINLTISAEWVELRGAIVSALAPYPDAKRAVVEVLRGRAG